MTKPISHSLQKRMQKKRLRAGSLVQGQDPQGQGHLDLEAHHRLAPAPAHVPARDRALVPVRDHLEVETLAARTQNLGQGNRVTQVGKVYPKSLLTFTVACPLGLVHLIFVSVINLFRFVADNILSLMVTKP
jgi:hypothetical protein